MEQILTYIGVFLVGVITSLILGYMHRKVIASEVAKAVALRSTIEAKVATVAAVTTAS